MFLDRVLIRSSAKPWPHWQSKNARQILPEANQLTLAVTHVPHAAFRTFIFADCPVAAADNSDAVVRASVFI
jgi:hypothetical protein